MTRHLRIGVIGAGGAAQVVHLPILKRLPDLEVAGLADPDDAKARTISERFGISHVAGSLGELAERVALDAVLVCTPNDTHEAVAVEALERGYHVLCERPISVDSASAARMIEAARAAERQLMVAMNERFRYDVRMVRQFVASGELGDIFFVRSSWLNQRLRRPRHGWRRNAGQSGGGVLIDLGTPAVDLALWLLGYPRVSGVTARFHQRQDVEDSAIVLLSVAGGTTVTVEVTWELMEERDRHAIYVLGTSGSATTMPFRVAKELETGLVDVTPPLDTGEGGLYTSSYRQEWAEFLRLVRGESSGELPVEQVQLMRVLEACYRSAGGGGEVEVEA